MDKDYINRVSWEEVGAFLNGVAERVDPHDFKGVYGIPRGGSVLGAWLAHKLYLPLLSEIAPNCIIVDDICDSGRTLEKVLDSIQPDDRNNCYVAVMYNNPHNSFSVDFCYREKGDSWIAFPWEQ